MSPSTLSLLFLSFLFSSFISISLSHNNKLITINTKPNKPKLLYGQKKICFPYHGCFTNEGPFGHHSSLPEHPDKVDVKMRLNTRATGSTLNATQVIDWRRPQSLNESTFDARKSTFIVVHGFLSGVDTKWLLETMEVALKFADVNFIRVGWDAGDWLHDYPQAVANTRVVGADIALLIDEVKKLAPPEELGKFWLIGHSLGAHIMSFVGRRHPNQIDMITGLDPARPEFEGEHADARLDHTDANFVDVIHTDATKHFPLYGWYGFGAREPMGHVDFYPNGGAEQPGCTAGESITIKKMFRSSFHFLVCNHERAHELFIESFRHKIGEGNCVFKSHPCVDYDYFIKERCRGCDEMLGCPIMGPYSIATRPSAAYKYKTYLLTKGSPPYCTNNLFDVEIIFGSGFRQVKGQIFYKITLPNGETIEEEEMTASNEDVLEPSKTIRRLMAEREDVHLDDIDEVQIRFKENTWNPFRSTTIRILRASIAPYDDRTDDIVFGDRTIFCLEGEEAFELTTSRSEWKTLRKC